MRICLGLPYSWSFSNGVQKRVDLLAARLKEVYASAPEQRLWTGRNLVPDA